MDSIIAAQCMVEQDTGLVLDIAVNRLPAGSVIMCKLTAFVIMEDGDMTILEVIKWRWSTRPMTGTSKFLISRSRS